MFFSSLMGCSCCVFSWKIRAGRSTAALPAARPEKAAGGYHVLYLYMKKKHNRSRFQVNGSNLSGERLRGWKKKIGWLVSKVFINDYEPDAAKQYAGSCLASAGDTSLDPVPFWQSRKKPTRRPKTSGPVRNANRAARQTFCGGKALPQKKLLQQQQGASSPGRV
jgi:hypothetical protein